MKTGLLIAAIAASLVSTIANSADPPPPPAAPVPAPSNLDPSIVVIDREKIAHDDSLYLANPVFNESADKRSALANKVRKCSITVENGPCFIEIGKEGTASLPTVRINSKSGRLELWVYRGPFQKVSFDAVTTLQLEPDVAAAIIKQWIDPLKSLTFVVRAPYVNSHISTSEFTSHLAAHPYDTQCLPRLQSLCDILDQVDGDQKSTELILQNWADRITTASNSLSGLKEIKWEDKSSSAVFQKLLDKFIEARIAFGNAPSKVLCEAPAQSPPIPAVRCRLPSDKVSTAHEQLMLARTIFTGYAPELKDLDKLTGKERVDTEAKNQAEVRAFQRISLDIQNLIAKQVDLESRLGDAKTAQDKLASIGDKLKDVDTDTDMRPLAIKKISSPYGSATTAIKITETDVWSGKETTITAPGIQWQYSKWELSAGIAISSLKKRSFGVAPELDSSGKPMMDGDKVISKIVKTSTSPTVFPVAYANYRIGDEEISGVWRTAWLGTIGIGVNDGNAEAFGGISYSIGGFYFTVGGHLGRLKKLGAGLKVDDTTTISNDDLSKFQKKGWIVRPGISFNYRVPVQ